VGIDHLLGEEPFGDAAGSRLPETDPQIIVTNDTCQRLRETVRVFGREKQPGALVNHGVLEPTDGTADHRAPGSHGFEGRYAQPFAARRQDERVARREEVGGVLAASQKLHLPVEPEPGRLCHQCSTLWSVAGDPEARPQILRGEQRQGVQQQVDSLATDQRGEDEQNQVSRTGSECRAPALWLMTTVAPSFANSFAISAPIPWDEPVTSARLPFSLKRGSHFTSSS